MKSKNKKISESDKKLDSLINTIQERAKSIKIEQVPFATDIKKIPYNPKRGGKEILTVDEKSNKNIYFIIQTYLSSSFSDDHNLVEEIKKKLELKANEDKTI